MKQKTDQNPTKSRRTKTVMNEMKRVAKATTTTTTEQKRTAVTHIQSKHETCGASAFADDAVRFDCDMHFFCMCGNINYYNFWQWKAKSNARH